MGKTEVNILPGSWLLSQTLCLLFASAIKPLPTLILWFPTIVLISMLGILLLFLLVGLILSVVVN